MYYVYVLRSVDEDKKLYLGYSADLKRRFREHGSDSNPSTAGRKWELVYYEAYATDKAARKREAALKRNRRMKQFLFKRLRDSLQ